MLLAYTDQSWPPEVYVHTKLMGSLFTNLFTTEVRDSSFSLLNTRVMSMLTITQMRALCEVRGSNDGNRDRDRRCNDATEVSFP